MNEVKSFALPLARQAGKYIKDKFTIGMQKEWKDDNTPITATDSAINDLVLREIKKTFPDHNILAEEGNHETVSEYTWVCDPIDGTIPFSSGYPTSVFSLALTKNGDPIFGVIYDPYIDRLVWAEKGKGAYLNEKSVFVSKTATFEKNVIDVEAIRSETRDILQLIPQLSQKGVWVISLRSGIYASMLTAIGELSATIANGTNAWDSAAVKIIVEEAGGVVTDLYGNPQRYDCPTSGFIASNGVIHQELVALVKPMVAR